MPRALRLSLALFCCTLTAGKPEPWVLIPQPKFHAHKVSMPIAGSKNTVLSAARWTEIGPEFVSLEEWKDAAMDEKKAAASTRQTAVAWLKEIKPHYVRNEQKIVEFALLKSDKVPVAATVLTPEFVKEFEGVFGPKMIVVIPNLYTVFVFPGIASNHNAYSDLILGAWHSDAPRVSREVFELTADGMKAIGIFDE